MCPTNVSNAVRFPSSPNGEEDGGGTKHRFGRLVMMGQRLRRALNGFSRHMVVWGRSVRLLGYSVLVGVGAGAAAVLFTLALELVEHSALGRIMDYVPPPEHTADPIARFQLPRQWWAVLLVPTLGGLLCGVIVHFLEPASEGHGTDAMIRAFHRLKGVIGPRVPLVKMVTSIVTIGTGGSAGREGPMTQIGAGIGSLLAQYLKLGDWDRRILMLAGAAGGLGAVFRTPLGGAMFSVEVLYSGTAIEFSAVAPAFVASVVAYTIFTSVLGQTVLFVLPTAPDPQTGALPCAFHGAHELPFYLALALLCAAVSYIFVNMFYFGRDRIFRPARLPQWLRPALGGLGLGIIVLVGYPHVMAGGYGWIQKAILASPDISLRLAISLVVLKMVATTLTVGSGGSGGLFAPALFIGTMTGAAFGMACQALFPASAPPVSATALVGMGGVLAGTFKVPLAALIMVSELTGSHDLLVPMMLVGAVEMVSLPGNVSLCREQVTAFIDSPAHLGDFVIDVFKEMHVRDVCSFSTQPIVLREDTPLPQILRTVADAHQTTFPVVDRDNKLVGVFSLSDLRAALVGDGAGNLVRAIDLAVPVPIVTPDDDLHTVLQIMAEKHLEELPVVMSHAGQQTISLIRRDFILAAYDRRVSLIQTAAASERTPV